MLRDSWRLASESQKNNSLTQNFNKIALLAGRLESHRSTCLTPNLMNLMNYKGIGWKLQVLRPFSNVFEVSGIAGTAYFCMTMGIGIKEVGREISTIVRGQRDCFNLNGGHSIDLMRVLPGGGWQPGVLDSQLVGDVRWSS